jgi:hypothetical protein
MVAQLLTLTKIGDAYGADTEVSDVAAALRRAS